MLNACSRLLPVSLFCQRYLNAMSGDGKYKVVFVLGAPGSGKGTQCSRISKTFNFVHLSAGDLLRAERDRQGSEYGQLIESHIKAGTIVPVEITCALLENAMRENANLTNGFLIDGFPRNDDNLAGWKREMEAKCQTMFLLFLECPEKLCVQRCLNRNQGRSDDNEQSLAKRIQTYRTQTVPIINYYGEQNLVKSVDSSQTAEQVFAKISELFNTDSSTTHPSNGHA